MGPYFGASLRLPSFQSLPRSEYKCGVFFRDLTPKVDFAWLGALPEAITRAQKDGASKKDIEDILGADVNVASYKGDVCGDTLANSRCYAQVSAQL